jgi:hypothetical protein
MGNGTHDEAPSRPTELTLRLADAGGEGATSLEGAALPATHEEATTPAAAAPAAAEERIAQLLQDQFAKNLLLQKARARLEEKSALVEALERELAALKLDREALEEGGNTSAECNPGVRRRGTLLGPGAGLAGLWRTSHKKQGPGGGGSGNPGTVAPEPKGWPVPPPRKGDDSLPGGKEGKPASHGGRRVLGFKLTLAKTEGGGSSSSNVPTLPPIAASSSLTLAGAEGEVEGEEAEDALHPEALY